MPGSQKNINLFTLAWSEELLKQTDPNIAIIDNSANFRPDWREYWPIRQYLLENKLDSNSYYGFFSPKFSLKTRLNGADVIDYINSNPGADVYTFSPQADMGAFFVNVFEQANAFYPEFNDISQEFFDEINLSINLEDVVMDSRHIVFSNFIVARPKFWEKWFEVSEKLFSIAECGEREGGGGSKLKVKLADALNAETTYPGAVPHKVFVMERIASLLIFLENFKCLSYSTYLCAWSGLPTNKFVQEAIASDALKMAYNVTKDRVFLNSFMELRNKIFHQ